MDENLLSDADQAISEASESLQRSSSLLERIHAQREREARSATEQAGVAATGSTDVEMNDNNYSDNNGMLQVPNYSPIANDAISGSSGGGGNPFGSESLGFSSFSMNFAPMGSNNNTERDQSSEALLSEQIGSLRNEYSMSAYFKMFVIDIYSVFRAMPVPGQIVTVGFLLWLFWRLI